MLLPELRCYQCTEGAVEARKGLGSVIRFKTFKLKGQVGGSRWDM